MNRRQTIPRWLRYTINDFNKQFPNDDACLEWLKERRYPNGIAYCEKCQANRKHYRITGRPVYSCDHCGTQISPMAGTIFEKSTTSLRLWFYAMYLMASTRCGISAKQIQRETGVTYKTAWRMFRQIRSLLSEPDIMLSQSVEMDETYYGGVRKGAAGRKMRGDRKKTPIVGMVERTTKSGLGRVKALAAANLKSDTVFDMVHEYILPSSTVFTDEAPRYDRLGARVGTHKRINHSSKVYVVGDIHTNTIEGFWSLVKLGIGGVYHAVSEKYLQTYLNEYAFRYNRRDQGNLIFESFLKRIVELASQPSLVPAETNPA